MLAAFLGTAAILSSGYIDMLPRVMWPTAHMAFILFIVAFTASSMQKLMPGAYSKWAMGNRRYIGLNFALVHFVHAGLVLSNLALTEASRPAPVLAVGGGAYFMLLLMALTSNDTSVKKLGAKNWKKLHKVGSYYLLALFFATSFRQPEAFTSFGSSWVAVTVGAALALKFAAARKTKKP